MFCNKAPAAISRLLSIDSTFGHSPHRPHLDPARGRPQTPPSGIMVGFVDGHAGKVPLRKLKTLYWHLGYVPVDDVWKTTP